MVGDLSTTDHVSIPCIVMSPSDRASAASAWFFQAQPREWNVDGYLEDVIRASVDHELNWLVTTHADAITTHDRVFLWRTGDRKTAGVVALATVIGPPAPRAEDKAAYRRAGFDGKYAKVTCRARLRLDKILAKPLYRERLRFLPGLADLSILTDVRRTNVPIDPQHEAELVRVCTTNGTVWELPEPDLNASEGAERAD